MPATPTCRPWCEEHKEESDECTLSRMLYTRRDEPKAPADSAFSGLAEALRQLSPDQADTVFLEVSYIEGAPTEMGLDFWNFDDEGSTDPVSTLPMTVEGLEELHARIGDAIRDLKQGHVAP